MCLERTLGEGFITELMELPRHSSKGKKQKEIITATITPSKRLMMKNHIPFCFLRPSIQRYDFPVSIFVVDNWHKASTNFKKQIGFNLILTPVYSRTLLPLMVYISKALRNMIASIDPKTNPNILGKQIPIQI